jgi:hypothetical protein
MLDIHGVEEGLGGDLTPDEIGIIRGALDLSHKTAATCMTPFDKARAPPAAAVRGSCACGAPGLSHKAAAACAAPFKTARPRPPPMRLRRARP